MQNDVVIITDKSVSKKIWVSNLIGNTTFMQVRNAANDEKELYNIPPSKYWWICCKYWMYRV